ncbi:MAG: molecular chaperone DnaJ [Proteobacteria bacterium]|nr:molecular chaperone DnaJ [Pseudomonadota bacterium]
MAHRDYYNVLGVGRRSSQDEIKRAYRALAMRFHPDRNSEPEAEQRFKDVTEAYTVLSDPEQRSRYDRLGPLYTPDGRPPKPEDVNEVIGSFFGGMFRRKTQDRGTDLRYTVSLTLEEVATGLDRPIVVPRRVHCHHCGGDGAEPEGGRAICEPCGGTGRSSGARLFRTSCYHCDGQGFTVVKPCNTCDGDGRISIEDSLVVKVPKGVATGQKLKLSGKGDAPTGSGEAGDLFVIVNVAEHTLFRRRGDDLLVELPLTFSEVATGADVVVPTIEGQTTIRIAPGTPSGKIFRLAGRGMPKVGRSGRGDLHLQVMLEVPTELSNSEREALAGWARALSASRHPLRAAFDEVVRIRSSVEAS